MKNHGLNRDLRFLGMKCLLCSGLDHRADAAGAHNFANLATVLKNRDLLQIRFEGARGHFLRPRPIAAKSRFLTTYFTLRHLLTSFSNQVCTIYLNIWYDCNRAILPQIVSFYNPCLLI